MVSVIARFKLRQKEVNRNGNDDDSDSDSEPKAKKTKNTGPAKKVPKDARSHGIGEPKQTMEDKENLRMGEWENGRLVKTQKLVAAMI